MHPQNSRKVLGWCLFIFLILACASPFASNPTPVPLPAARMEETLNAAIANTSVAAQAQTQTALPPTSTPTLTFTPSKTPTPVTPSPTVWLYFVTPTYEQSIMQTYEAFTATAAASGSGGSVDWKWGRADFTPIPTEMRNWDNQWRCYIRSKPGRVSVEPRKKFTVYWTVVNTGWNDWSANTVDVVHTAGFRGVGANIDDIRGYVKYGWPLTVSATFIAPNRTGFFHSRYTVKVDASRPTPLCTLFVDFEVKWK